MHAKVNANAHAPFAEEAAEQLPAPLRAAPPGESTRPIRALNRGLAVLAELNRLERAPINTLASALDLPRTTTYRILETLRLAGYIERDAHDDCYRPTLQVRALAAGFGDGAMLAHLAKPHLALLCAQITWPVALATPAGGAMVIRETTDHQSPLALEQHGTGMRMPMLASAAGRAYLACCDPATRETLIELLARSSSTEDRLARSRAEIERLLEETRAQGFALAQRARRVSHETSLAIAVRGADRVLASLLVRFAASAVTLKAALDQFLPKMREAALRIERAFEQQSTGAVRS